MDIILLGIFLYLCKNQEVTEEKFQTQFTKFLDTNADMFLTDIDGMPVSQIAFLRAVCMGETHFNAQQVVAEYGLGAPRTIPKTRKHSWRETSSRSREKDSRWLIQSLNFGSSENTAIYHFLKDSKHPLGGRNY